MVYFEYLNVKDDFFGMKFEIKCIVSEGRRVSNVYLESIEVEGEEF